MRTSRYASDLNEQVLGPTCLSPYVRVNGLARNTSTTWPTGLQAAGDRPHVVLSAQGRPARVHRLAQFLRADAGDTLLALCDGGAEVCPRGRYSGSRSSARRHHHSCLAAGTAGRPALRSRAGSSRRFRRGREMSVQVSRECLVPFGRYSRAVDRTRSGGRSV
jgi:hypothetical protein